MAQQLPDWLSRRARWNSDKRAIYHVDGDLTYGELFHLASRLATTLVEHGVKQGDRVAVLTKNGRWFAIALHALMQASAIVVPVNWRLTAREIAWQFEDAGVKLCIHDEACRALALEISRDVGGPLTLFHVEEQPISIEAKVSRSHICLSEIHALVYTSGTTGSPKGAMISYGNHWWSATASALQLGVDSNDKWLVPMPLFHVGGMAVLMRSLIYGTAAVIHDGFDEMKVVNAIRSEGITIVSLVPTMLNRILQHLPKERLQSNLRAVLLGGSSIPKPLLEACQERGIPVASSYGLTEANSQVTTLPPEEAIRKFGSAGRPLMPTEVKIQPDGNAERGFPTGEILVRGPTVISGYWKRPDATQEALKDGWLHTGDVGYLDDEGYLYVLDRRNDLIVSGGENVYPAEVEAVLLSHPGVREAGVVGKADDDWGQVPVAYLVMDPGWALDENELRAYCRERLAGYKVPKAFRAVPELPRNASGKLLRRILKTW
jgi:O-succinylbenzoic acid--CoA ligase